MKKNSLIFSIVIVSVMIIVVGAFFIAGKTYKAKNPVATIQIEGYESPIKIELDPKSAPSTVANFIKLANSGFYTDYTMSIETNKITGDDSVEKARISRLTGQTDKDYIYGLKGEFLANGYKENHIRHEKGIITMEREKQFGLVEEENNLANCTFSILTDAVPGYNGNNAGFGKVIEGMDVLDQIASSRVEKTTDETGVVKTGEVTLQNNQLNEANIGSDINAEENINKIKIKSITVDTFGADYGNPETVNYNESYQKVQQIYSQYFGGSSSVVAE